MTPSELNGIEQTMISGMQAHAALKVAFVALRKVRCGDLSPAEAQHVAEQALHRMHRIMREEAPSGEIHERPPLGGRRVDFNPHCHE